MVNASAQARPYAKATFAYAKENQAIEVWQTFFWGLKALIEDDRVQAYLANPRFSSSILLTHFREAMHPFELSSAQVDFFNLLAESHRLGIGAEIANQFEQKVFESSRVLSAEVTSARALTPEQSTQLKATLGKVFDSTLNLSQIVDPACISGLRIQVGDWVFDQTLQGRIDGLKTNLLKI